MAKVMKRLVVKLLIKCWKLLENSFGEVIGKVSSKGAGKAYLLSDAFKVILLRKKSKKNTDRKIVILYHEINLILLFLFLFYLNFKFD
jgi:hypothetical protein